MIEDLYFLYSDSGAPVITSSASIASIYDDKGYDRSASFFDSYSGKGSRIIQGYIDNDTREVHYATTDKDAHVYTEKRYSKIDGSFSVSLKPRNGLKAIYEVEKDGLVSFVPASLKEAYTRNGYTNNGLAWYSPINTGNVRISQIETLGGDQSAPIDNITGNLVFNYEVDNLHFSQYTDTVNTLSFRILVECVDGRMYSQNLPDIDLSHDLDTLTGSVSTDFLKTTGLSLEEIAFISIAGVAKYGRESSVTPDSPSSNSPSASELADQLDAGYGFFRANSVRISGDGLTKIKRSNATPMNKLGPQYFVGSPGYYNQMFRNEDFRGAPLQNVNCFSCHFEGNDFTGADMSGFYSLKQDGPGGEVYSPTYGRDNPNKFKGISTGNPGYRYDTIFGAEADGNPKNDAPWYVGDFTDAQMTDDSFKIQYYYEATQGNGSSISVENTSTKGADIRLEHLNSATMEIGSTRLSDKTRFMKAYGYRQKNYYDQGLYDVEGSIDFYTYRGIYRYTFGVRNPAGSPAHFFLGGQEMHDNGKAAFLKWEYTGSLFGLKSWKLSVVDWTPPNNSADSSDEVLPVFQSREMK